MGVSDVKPTVVGHFLLQGTDVCWERRGAQTLLVSCGSFVHLFIHSFIPFCSPTMYQVFTLRNVWKQLVECLVVLHETLKERRLKQKSAHFQMMSRRWAVMAQEQLSTKAQVLFHPFTKPH